MTPTNIGGYEVLHAIKSGGMGAVLLARRRGPGAYEQLVAIKTIRPEFASAEHLRAMFLDEAALLARLSHPHIAHVYDFGEESDALYMVMEYVAGIPFHRLDDLDPPPTIVARAIAEAARGLHAAHELEDLKGHPLGVVHRDISPDNLMLGFDGHVKVIDFGIALVKNRQAPVTEYGTVKGKPPYMAPEQVKNEPIDRRADVFSLAIVLHEMLARRPLFDGDSIYAIARAVEHQPILRPSEVRGRALPDGLDAVVMRALERDVARRTPTAAALASELEDVVAAEGGESLAAWTARTLAPLRDEHRAWLASVVAGVADTAPIGRPTGAVTAINAGVVEPAALSTHLPPASAPEVLATDAVTTVGPHRRRAPLVLGVLLLLGLAVAILAVTRVRTPPGVAPDEAGVIVAPIVVDAPGVDATVVVERDAAIVVDARVPIDAPAPRAPRDGRAPLPRSIPIPIDAPAAPPPDAAVVSAPVGTGLLSVFPRTRGAYLQVMLDGKLLGPTPIVKRVVAAGTHAIQLLAPDTSEVVFEQQIVVSPGAGLTVRQP
ncbi:MAG: protein kinase [Proteobacteria bacterium]|nr:protein kinase [Pseudomonadota bacterium]